MTTIKRRGTRAVVACLAVVTLAGCDIGNLNSTTLPGGIATGDEGFEATAVFDNVNNLVPNSQVLYADVPVGTITSIDVDKNWRAKVTFKIKKDAGVPANVRASVGQKSLLGAEYVQLDLPDGTQATGALRATPAIPLSRTQAFPETENVLAAVSLLLNNGGLAQIRTIVDQLSTALDGREGNVRELLTSLEKFAGNLDAQKNDIITATESLNALASSLGRQTDKIDRTLTNLAPGLEVLKNQRSKLTTALTSLRRLSGAGRKLIDQSRDGLRTNLALLKPTLTKLREAGKDLPDALMLAATFPFPLKTLQGAFKGDYANLFVTLDLTLPSLQHNFLGSVPVLGGSKVLGSSMQRGNPSTLPLTTTPSPTASTPATPSPSPSTTRPTAPTSGATPTPTPTTTCNPLARLLGGC